MGVYNHDSGCASKNCQCPSWPYPGTGHAAVDDPHCDCKHQGLRYEKAMNKFDELWNKYVGIDCHELTRDDWEIRLALLDLFEGKEK